MSKIKSQSIEYQKTVEVVNANLAKIIDEKIGQARHISEDYAQLWESIKLTALAGGKRIRPYLVSLAFTSYGGDPNSEDLLRAATAVEVFHVAILIHDDIIDRDFKRHSSKNMSGLYQDKYAPFIKNKNDLDHHANGAAILGGDLLIAESFNLLNSLKVDAETKIDVLGVFYQAVFDVCGGELLDVEASIKKKHSETLTISEFKTASYSFVGPLLIGASLAKASGEEQTKLRYFAKALGIAYQLKDDLLGTFGDQEKTGKTNVGDIREAKQTYLITEFYRLASNKDKRLFKSFFGNSNLSDIDYLRVKELLISSGAKAACEDKIINLKTEAEGFLSSLNINDKHRELYEDFIKLCLGRDG